MYDPFGIGFDWGGGNGAGALFDAEAAIAALGPIARWKFDEGAGQTITDHSGNGFTATMGQDATVEAGEPTWASYGVDCVLDSARNWINTASTLGISGGAARTVICVAQINRDLGQGGLAQGGGFGCWVGSGTLGERWHFLPAANTNDLQLLYGTGANNFVFTNLSPMPDLTWMFLALTQSGSNVNTCVAYRDGLSQAVTNSQVLNTTGNFEMMSRGNTFGGSTWGKIAYQLVFNYALAAPQIATVRAALTDILAARGITLP